MSILYTLTLNMSTLWKAYAFHLAKGVDIFSISCVLFICGRVGCVADTTHTSILVIAYTYVHTCTWLCTNMCKHVHTRAWLCTNMGMYKHGYVYAHMVMCPTWLCAHTVMSVVMPVCVHGYAPCVVMCVHVYVCSHGHGYVWLCYVCYVMLCYVMSVMYTSTAATIVYTSINILSSLYLRQHKKIIYVVNYFFCWAWQYIFIRV